MKKQLLLVAVLLLSFSIKVDAQSKNTKGKQLFGDLTARHIGPALMSGRINDLENHPTNNRIIYAGTAGGGVWKSNDGGVTFNPIFDDYCQSIGAVEVDPNDPDNTIYVGTGETWTRNSVSYGDGLYKTVDGGVTWDKIGFENSDRIANIIVNPKNSNEIYVGVLGALWGDSEERGVYKSSDAGKTWDKILYTNQKTGCADLTMDPNNPNILYASMWEFRRTGWSFESGGKDSALYKSIDGGTTWNKIHNGFPEGSLGRLAIAVAPSDSNILYTVIEAEKNERKGLYRSDDAGANWKQLNNDFGITVRPFYFSRIVVDPKNPDVVVKGGLSGSISRDGGKTFKNLGNMHSDIHDITFDIHNSDRMYAGTDGGVYRSLNGGTTMEIVENLPISQFYQVSVDDAEPYNIYGGLQDNGSWYGPSSSPGGIEARDWNSIGAGDGFRVLKHPTKNIIYSEMQGAENVWRYDVDAKRVKTIQPLPQKGFEKFRFNWNAPMAISAHQPNRFYMGSQYVHKSEDMGDTWTIISPDLTTNDPLKQDQSNSGGLSMDNSGAENHTTIFTIAESTLDENIIWVGTDDGNVQVTQDGGETWTNTIANVPDLPKNTWTYHIEASVFNKGTAYVVFDGHTMNDMKPYTYKTTDFGKTWTSIITSDVVGSVRNIQEDYVNPDLLFLGTEFGLYITINGGKNWIKFTNNMPAVAVHFIELQKQTNDLVMGTHGRGIIIIDDISPLREINEEVLKEKVHFFTSKPTVIFEEGSFAGSFGAETQFVGANPSRAAQIKYHLSRRHTFGKMTLEIQDDNGKVISKLGPGKSKGINIVNWNYRLKNPKVAKGKTFSFGGFTSPLVEAGTYNVVLKKGKDTFTQKIELIYDPKSNLSASDREMKHNTTMKMYNMTEELAYMVYELDAILEKAETLNKKKIVEKLTALKKTLVITTGDNYVGSAEPQLREKMSDLYSKIATSYDKPSNSELESLSIIEERFDTAKVDYQKIKKKVKFLDELNLKSFEEFIK
ncbi:WD40/YVTN/BNR-like repeat-containing protein [Polaribacter sp. Asnod6-C07]|uniref:WD40/YVTN/BNR-like repeat-containing protein n=1 Tax=Polaribacter sp. Asnod6-C07 TaxID=3160582 RepID=UPI003869FB52